MSEVKIPDIREYLYFRLLPQIPPGKVTTYQVLAEALGDPLVARSVARLLSENPYAPYVPCHRVVYSDGRVGGYSHPEGVKKKIEILQSEGVRIKEGKVENFNKILFKDFETDYPLKRLREWQIEICKGARIIDEFSGEYLIGIDTSYEGDRAFTCAVVQYGKEYKLYFSECVVEFPYIPTYLSFREFKPIRRVVETLPSEIVEDAVFIIDGNGILHPFRCGLATYVGVSMNIPTIGVAKSKLCGKVIDNDIYLDSLRVGKVIRSSSKREIYVSPGHRISVESSYEIVKKNVVYSLPEVLRLAHLHSNKFRKSKLCQCRLHALRSIEFFQQPPYCNL